MGVSTSVFAFSTTVAEAIRASLNDCSLCMASPFLHFTNQLCYHGLCLLNLEVSDTHSHIKELVKKLTIAVVGLMMLLITWTQ